jgi:hypothetical protein
MAKFAAQVLIKTSQDTFPVTEPVVITQALFVEIENEGVNAVDYEFVGSGETGRIKRGNKLPFNSTSDTFADTVEITFYAPAKVNVSWTDGTPGGGGGGGLATSANQVIIQNYLNGTTPSVLSGQIEDTELVEVVALGVQVTDVALSLTILFDGEDGKLDGVTVPDGFIATYTGTLRNQVASIAYVVPTVGNKRVLIAYTKI